MMNDGSLSPSLSCFTFPFLLRRVCLLILATGSSRDKFAALDWYRLSSSNKNWEINVLSNVLGYVLSFNDWTAALILFRICIPDLFFLSICVTMETEENCAASPSVREMSLMKYLSLHNANYQPGYGGEL